MAHNNDPIFCLIKGFVVLTMYKNYTSETFIIQSKPIHNVKMSWKFYTCNDQISLSLQITSTIMEHPVSKVTLLVRF